MGLAWPGQVSDRQHDEGADLRDLGDPGVSEQHDRLGDEQNHDGDARDDQGTTGGPRLLVERTGACQR